MRGIVVGFACAGLVACAMGGRKSAMQAPPPRADSSAGAVMPTPGSPEHDEIARLDQAIVDELAAHGQTPAPEGTCGASCDLGPVAMDARPIAVEDPQGTVCKPGASDTCKDSCTLSDSICKSSDRICTIAHELGDHDAYANDKCVRGSASCKQSKERCCSCL